MRTYLVPPTCHHGTTLPPDPPLVHPAPLDRDAFAASMLHRTSSRFFIEQEVIDGDTLRTQLIEPLARVQAATPGVRFICAIRSAPDTGTVFHLEDDGTLTNPVVPNQWVDLYLQEEFATSPFVAVAVVEVDCEWRTFDHRVVSSSAALSRLWFDARCGRDPLEGSIFAGILAGWLRTAGMIGTNESTGVALALGKPQVQPTLANTPQ